MTKVGILGTVEDRNKSLVTIKFCESLGGSIIIPMFMREAAALIEKGWAQQSLMGTNESKVIFADIDGEVAGFIVFNIQNDFQKTTWIVLGTVFEKYRRRGLYKIMHDYLEKIAKNSGSAQINSHVHFENQSMLAACQSIDKKTLFYKTTKEL
jgi:hypothetical protein